MEIKQINFFVKTTVTFSIFGKIVIEKNKNAFIHRQKLRREIEQHLIEKAAKGDAAAFSEIYDMLGDSIYGFTYRMTNKSFAAEDITQEVFMFFVEHPEKYDAQCGSLFSFLCGVARNRVFNFLKKSGTRLETTDFEVKDVENFTNHNGHSPLKILLDKEVSAKIAECVAKLAPLQREVLILRETEDLTYEEIAVITETDIGVVKSRLYRARRNLARELAPYLADEKEKYYEVH